MGKKGGGFGDSLNLLPAPIGGLLVPSTKTKKQLACVYQLPSYYIPSRVIVSLEKLRESRAEVDKIDGLGYIVAKSGGDAFLVDV